MWVGGPGVPYVGGGGLGKWKSEQIHSSHMGGKYCYGQ